MWSGNRRLGFMRQDGLLVRLSRNARPQGPLLPPNMPSGSPVCEACGQQLHGGVKIVSRPPAEHALLARSRERDRLPGRSLRCAGSVRCSSECHRQAGTR